jgi:hypothetical protein
MDLIKQINNSTNLVGKLIRGMIIQLQNKVGIIQREKPGTRKLYLGNEIEKDFCKFLFSF